MSKYICENVFVPLRSAPSHKSEMLSQVLFGEKYEMTDQSGHWIKIKTLFDNYSGWIDLNHLQHSDDTDSKGLVLRRSLLCYRYDNTKLVLEPGCEIHNPDFDRKIFRIGNNVYKTIDVFSQSFLSSSDTLTDTAMKMINSPYIWGGRIPSGIDCSGLTQLVYKINGKAIPRDSREQAEAGENIGFIEETRPGDLVFFENDNALICHVGMIISNGLIIHASGRVRIDTIDHNGIYKHEIRGYSHKLRSIRRIIMKSSEAAGQD